MIQSGRPTAIKQRWIFFLALLLMLYLAVQIVQAQEASPQQEPTPVAADAPMATFIATDEPTLVVGETSGSSLTPEPTIFPTDDFMATFVVTDEATVAVGEPADSWSTPVPTDDFMATFVATDEPTLTPVPANISITASIMQVSENNLLTLTISAEGLSEVTHVAVACRVDPTLLQGIQVTAGDMLLPDLSTVTDTGFQPDGLWILLGNQNDDVPPLASLGTLWTFNYQVVGTGVIEINCQAEIGDRNNQTLILTNPNPSLRIDPDQTVTAEPSPTPSLVATEAVMTAEATEAIITETPTDIPATSTPDTRVHISGQIESIIPLRQTGVIVSANDINQILVVQDNGTYSADLVAGEYHFIFTSLYCLPVIVPVTIVDKPLRLPTVTLIGGDVDGNGLIDRADALLITQNFGSSIPLVLPSADLNGDGVVNIYDLALVSANIRS